MRTVDSPESPQTGTTVEIGLDSQPATDSSTFEEIIDLSTVPSKPLKGSPQIGDSLMNHSEDSFNINNLDNGHMSEGGDASAGVSMTKPVIAFEENAKTRQDVPGITFYHTSYCQLGYFHVGKFRVFNSILLIREFTGLFE